LKKYFGLNEDIHKIVSEISKDQHIKKAVETYEGLRILNQNKWECLISFICATYKNIPAIKQMLSILSKKFGDKIVFDGRTFFSFPTPKVLSETTIKELLKCGLGYRAKYVLETAKTISNDRFDLENLHKKSYERARAELLTLPGVGLKVADCILLFSFKKLESFPVDVWIKRILVKYYSNHFDEDFIKNIMLKNQITKTEYNCLNSFGRNYFGKYAGYAQEYLYHFERTKHKFLSSN
jgi:N-glycosylase/DNA lyase